MTTLYLIRHGQASFGARNYDELSETGVKQAQILGQHWRQLNLSFDAVYSGEMLRQRDSAIHAGHEPQILAGLNEYDFQGVVRAYLPVVAQREPGLALNSKQLYTDPKQFQALFEKAIALWTEGADYSGERIEPWSEFTARCEDALMQAAASGRERVALFTSGGVISVALRRALGLSDERTFALNWRIHNASVHRFKLGRRGLSMLAYNEIGHLELERDPALLTFR